MYACISIMQTKFTYQVQAYVALSHHLTESNCAGLAMYEHTNSISLPSTTVMFSGLTLTIGGTRENNELPNKIFTSVNHLHRTSSVNLWRMGLSFCSRRTEFSASQIRIWPFSNRDAANTKSLCVMYVPSLWNVKWYYKYRYAKCMHFY